LRFYGFNATNANVAGELLTLQQEKAVLCSVAPSVQRCGFRDMPSTWQARVEEVTGSDKDVDVVVDVFNRVNSGGIKLSKGDLALAKVCADCPEARDYMKDQLLQWEDAGFSFDLDWLLGNVNTVLTGEARFRALHNVRRSQFEDGLKRSIKACNFLLNLVSSRSGLDHDRVLFGRYGFPCDDTLCGAPWRKDA
jgi:hypothetical protein